MGVTGSGFRVMRGLALCCMLGVGVARALQAETTGSATRIRVDLTDGSSLVGQSGIEAVAVRTDYAVLSMPLAAIKILTRESRSLGVVVSALNGDRITGELDIGKWPVTTAVGPLVLDPALIRQVTPVADRASGGKGLVLWNGLGSAEEVRKSFVGPGATLLGDVRFVPGRNGNGAQINGAGGIQFPPESMRGFDQPTTIEMWIRIPDEDRDDQLLLWNHHSSRGASLWMALLPGRILGLGLINASGDTFVEPAPVTGPLVAGSWCHVAVTWDLVNLIEGCDTARLYLNGKKVFRTSARPRGALNPFRPAGTHLNYMLGCQGYAGAINDSVFPGVMDELKVWDHVITEFPEGTP